VNDLEAAIGELIFALRMSSSQAEIAAIAEQLQRLGEFRQSQRAASRLLEAGVHDLRVWRLAYPQAYLSVVTQEASRLAVEPALIWAIMRQESAFFPKAVSSSNAQGLMQVVPRTWDWLAELQQESPANPFDLAANIRYGTFYLKWLHDYFSTHQSDPELVISSYNRGQGYIKTLFESPIVGGNKDELYREIDALETREYLQKVVLNYQIYKLLYGN
jgi:soluble lytic murein transglycosylase